MLRRHRTGAPIEHTNRGARPPIPAVVMTPAPPPAALGSTPDTAVAGPLDVTGLDGVDWARLDHAHGPAGDVPDAIRALARDTDDWAGILDELRGDTPLHQGTRYSATAPALSFLARLAVSGAPHRLDLYLWLVSTAGRWADGIVGDADRAAVRGRAPEPAPWTADVRRVIGAELPALLGRWDTESPATR